MSFIRAQLILVFVLSLIGCASSLKESLDKIETGMDKSEVIDKAGSPNRSYRQNEHDIWLYRIHDDESSMLHEVTFNEGRVIYTGPERDQLSKKGSIGLKTKEQAEEELRQKLQPNKKPKQFKEIKEDGTF